MIRWLTAFAFVCAGVVLHAHGSPLWPNWLTYAGLCAGAALALGSRRDALSAGVIAAMIVAMLAPVGPGLWHAWMMGVTVAAAWLVVRWRPWSAAALSAMFPGYALLIAFPGSEAVWTGIELAGVAAIAMTGGPLDETIRAVGRAVRGGFGMAARAGAGRHRVYRGSGGLVGRHRRGGEESGEVQK